MVSGHAQADEGAAGYLGVGAENALAGFGEERAPPCEHALDFASAEPEAAGGIEGAAVAHAVPGGGARRRGRR